MGARTSLLALVLALGLFGCGSSSTEDLQVSEGASGLLKTAEIEKEPAGSVERAFLDYWSNLQYRSWADAATFYDPRFRDFVGTAAIVGAKKLNGSVYPVVKPEIGRVDLNQGNTTVYYTLLLPDGTEELDSITWRKVAGSWQIVYDSRLDAELGQLATNRAEIEENGAISTSAATPLSEEAVRAGKAAEEKQAQFLERELETSGP
jgi:hypothetical protein